MKTNTLEATALYWASFNRFEFRLPGEAVEDVAQSGDNMPAVEYWADSVRACTAELYKGDTGNPWNPTPDRIREELAEHGAWDAEELADDEANWRRIVWLAAHDISEEDAPDCSAPVFAGN